MNKERISDIRRNNKTALIGHAIEAVIIVLIYLVYFFRNERSLAYTAMIISVTLCPVLAGGFFFYRDRETSMAKHTVGIGFAITYSIMTMTAQNASIYVMAVPMILLISVFNDAKYSAEINAGSLILNLIMTIGGAYTGKFGYRDIDHAIIQIASMTLVGIYSIYVAQTSKANNQQKLESIKEEQLKAKGMSDEISSLYSKLQADLGDIYSKIGELNISSVNTKDSMKEVSVATSETAGSVQNQLLLTEEIQQKVALVSKSVDQISENMNQTMESLKSADDEVAILVTQAMQTTETGAGVSSKLEILDQYIDKMNSIVDLIGGVASQTGLLSLNASIEAARAGEAGRGFSVVATEISKMATQTENAARDITVLIGNISSAISEVVSMVREMIVAINEEKQSTDKVMVNFADIRNNSLVVRKNIDSLNNDVSELKTVNEQIVSSTETISAISEEVSAHASQTMDAQEKNTAVLTHITERMQSLLDITK